MVAMASSASALLRKLEGGQHDVKADDADWIKVWAWIEAAAPSLWRTPEPAPAELHGIDLPKTLHELRFPGQLPKQLAGGQAFQTGPNADRLPSDRLFASFFVGFTEETIESGPLQLVLFQRVTAP
jgi:hypothetical protein